MGTKIRRQRPNLEDPAADYLICDKCASYLPAGRADYTRLKDDDYIKCGCGAKLCKKSEL